MKFGDLLLQYRKRAGLSQAALGRLAGLDGTHISRIERGRQGVPYPHTVARLVYALTLSPSETKELYDAAGIASPPELSPPISASAGYPGGLYSGSLSDIIPSLNELINLLEEDQPISNEQNIIMLQFILLKQPVRELLSVIERLEDAARRRNLYFPPGFISDLLH